MPWGSKTAALARIILRFACNNMPDLTSAGSALFNILWMFPSIHVELNCRPIAAVLLSCRVPLDENFVPSAKSPTEFAIGGVLDRQLKGWPTAADLSDASQARTTVDSITVCRLEVPARRPGSAASQRWSAAARFPNCVLSECIARVL
jgi:hypothetical protein